MSEDTDVRRGQAESILSTNTAPGSMSTPGQSQRTLAKIEEHNEEIAVLEAELDRRAETIINLTASLEFERSRRQNGHQRRG